MERLPPCLLNPLPRSPSGPFPQGGYPPWNPEESSQQQFWFQLRNEQRSQASRPAEGQPPRPRRHHRHHRLLLKETNGNTGCIILANSGSHL